MVLVTKKDGGNPVPVESGDGEGCLPLTPDRRYPGYVGWKKVVFEVGFSQWLLAGLPVSGGQV